MPSSLSRSWHGPRVVGGTYWNHYWRETYKVLSMNDNEMMVEWQGDGDYSNSPRHKRTSAHCTAWDSRDKVISHKPVNA